MSWSPDLSGCPCGGDFGIVTEVQAPPPRSSVLFLSVAIKGEHDITIT